MTENPNQAEAKEARILLHSEGDGTCLPPLMGEKQLTAQEFTPYYFIAAALGVLSETDEAQNGHGWCMTETDVWGTPTNTYLSKLFTDLPTSENMTSERRNRIQSIVDDMLKDPELTMSKRNDYIEKVKSLMRDVVARECSSSNSPKYLQFGEEAKKALDMIVKK